MWDRLGLHLDWETVTSNAWDSSFKYNTALASFPHLKPLCIQPKEALPSETCLHCPLSLSPRVHLRWAAYKVWFPTLEVGLQHPGSGSEELTLIDFPCPCLKLTKATCCLQLKVSLIPTLVNSAAWRQGQRWSLENTRNKRIYSD